LWIHVEERLQEMWVLAHSLHIATDMLKMILHSFRFFLAYWSCFITLLYFRLSLFILCRLWIVCVVLCAVFRLIFVLFCVMCVICVLCLIVVPLPPGRNRFSVTITNNNNNSILYYLCPVSTAVRPITDTAQCTRK
jgi:hypothetical protein